MTDNTPAEETGTETIAESAPSTANTETADNADSTSVENTEGAESNAEGDTQPPSEDAAEEESGRPDLGYAEHDHPALKKAVDILRESKIPVEVSNAIFSEAIETGDLSKIDRDTLVAKVGQEKADLILVLAESYYKTEFESVKKIESEVYTLVGGKEVYDGMKEWVAEKEVSDKDFAKDMNDLRAMIASNNPRIVKAAVNELFDMYKADPKTTIPASVMQGDYSAGGRDAAPLSRAEYIKLTNEAHKKGNYDKVHKTLWARRQAGMKQGI